MYAGDGEYGVRNKRKNSKDKELWMQAWKFYPEE